MVIQQVLDDEPPSPRKLDANVPRDLETICLKCLRKEPAGRYGTALALAEELERFLAGRPILARSIGPAERLARWCRRNPALACALGLAGVGLVFGVVTLAVSYVRVSRALAESKAAYAEADENLGQARQAVDDLLTRVSEETLLDQPGMQPLRRDLLRRARDYYRQFLGRRGSEGLRDDMALGHFRVGLITEEIDSTRQAMDCYEEARRLQEKLLAGDPENPARLKAMGDTLNAMGRAWHKQARPDQALEAYAAAAGVRRRLVAAEPAESEWRRVLANTYMNTALVEKDRDPASARRSMEESQAIRRQLLAGGPADAKLRRDLAAGAYNLATLAMAQGDFPAAEQALGQARLWFDELAGPDRRDLTAAYQLAVCYRIHGDLKCQQKQRAEARRLYDQARAVMEPLAEKNPSVPEYQVALAEIHINVAQAEMEEGQPTAATAAFGRAASLLTPLVDACVENPRYCRDLVVTMRALGLLEADIGRRNQMRQTLESLRQRLQQRGAPGEEPSALRSEVEAVEAAIKALQAAPPAPKPTPGAKAGRSGSA